MSRIVAVVCVALLPAATGCHAYSTVEGVPDVGRTVEVRLDTVGRRGDPTSGVLTGEVVSAAGDSIRLAVPADRLDVDGEDTVAVPYAAAETMRYRSVSVWKSAAVAGGIVAATALTFEVAASGGALPGQGPGGGAEEAVRLRVPLLGW